jgi:hypothetical protein
MDFGGFGTAGVKAYDGVVGQRLPAELVDEAIERGDYELRYFDGDDKEVHGVDRTAGLPSVAVLDGAADVQATEEVSAGIAPTRWTVTAAGEQGPGTDTSRVYFAAGREADARRLADESGIADVEPITEEIAARAHGADLVVLVGRDRSSRDVTPRIGILNGTTVTGLGGSIRDDLVNAGWNVIAVGNGPDNTLESSTVYFADGHEDSARRLAIELGIEAVEPVTDELQGVMPQAQVLVVAGRDREA